MKHLKAFESFNQNDTISILNDIFQELNDEDFTIHSYLTEDGTITTQICIRGNTDDGLSNVKRFNTKDVYDDVLRSIDYMEDEGWMLKKIDAVGMTNKKRTIRVDELLDDNSTFFLNLIWIKR